MARVPLIVAGEAVDDLVFPQLERLPRPGEEVVASDVVRTFGGGALITAVTVKRLGLDCRLLSIVSSAATAFLRREGVPVRALASDSEAFALAVGFLQDANRSGISYRGANDRLEPALLEALPGVHARHLHLSLTPVDCTRWSRVLGQLRERGTTTSWDFGWSEDLPQQKPFHRLIASLDLVFLNRQEATFYSARPALADALDFWRVHARHVIVKQGEEGALWIGEHGDEHSSARRVRVVDRTGAGDAFNGAFLYGFLRGLARPECLRLGNVVAGRCIGKVGAVNGLPRSDEVRLAAGTGR